MPKSKDSKEKIVKRNAYIQSLKNGTTRVEACEAAGVTTTTIWRWEKEDENFAREVEVALESRITIVEDALLKTATGVAGKGQVIAQIFWLKNRGKGRWKDKQEIDIKVPDTIKVKAFIQAGSEPVIKEEEPKKIEEKVKGELQGEDTKETETVL